MKTTTRILTTSAILLVMFTALFVWLNSGYRRIGAPSYAYALALVSATNRHDESRVQRIVNELDEQDLPAYDRKILQRIAQTALDGDWEVASTSARELLEAQVHAIE